MTTLTVGGGEEADNAARGAVSGGGWGVGVSGVGDGGGVRCMGVVASGCRFAGCRFVWFV